MAFRRDSGDGDCILRLLTAVRNACVSQECDVLCQMVAESTDLTPWFNEKSPSSKINHGGGQEKDERCA